METLLTVVIPAYNAEKYIKYTLAIMGFQSFLEHLDGV